MLKVSIVSCLLLCISNSIGAKIVFHSSRDGNIEIYVMENDGRNVQRLTTFPLPDMAPRWSPNGKQIVFMRVVDEVPKQQQIDLFIMNDDGSDIQRITTHPNIDVEPVWSPDGKRIAFISLRSGSPNIHIINIETRKVQQLTHYNEREDMHPKEPFWSPDGKCIAYTMDVLPDGEWTTIYLMDANGKRQRPLLKGEGTYRSKPRWSPDSKYIMYCDSKYGPQLQLISSKVVIRHKNGKLLRERHMPKGWLVDSACWTENKNQILITAKDPKLKYEIYRYDLNNGKIINLTNHPSGDLSPDYWWKNTTLDVSPIGKKPTQWGQLKSIELLKR